MNFSKNKKDWNYLLIVFFFSLTHPLATHAQEKCRGPRIYLEEFTGTVYTEKDPSLNFLGGTGYWETKREDILAAEALISRHLAKQAPAIHQKLKNYHRQYVGILFGKRRIVYSSFSCSPLREPNPECNFIVVKDGGDCYFQIYADLDRVECFSFSVNGEA